MDSYGRRSCEKTLIVGEKCARKRRMGFHRTLQQVRRSIGTFVATSYTRFWRWRTLEALRSPAMLYSPARLLLLIVALVTVTPACGFAAAPSAACTRLPLAARASFLAVVMQQPKAA